MANPDRSVYDPPFDDDLMFDTVDEQESSRGRPLMILLGIVVVLAFAGVVWVAYRQGVDHASRNEPPLLAQDPGPTRVAPTETQTAAVPNNPIYDEIDGAASAAAPPAETLAPPAEEPASLPPPAPDMTASAPAATAEPTPDMTVAEIPPSTGVTSAPAPSGIPAEISSEPVPSSVDPLPAGASLPPAPDVAPPAIDMMPTVPAGPTPAEIAAAKAEKDRLAREAAAKKAEAARIAEAKRLQQLAAAKPAPAAPAPAAPAITDPGPIVAAEPSSAAASGTDASGRPTLLTPPAIDDPLPQPSAAPASPMVTASAPPATRSEVVPDETPAVAEAAPTAGQFVVQIGAYNTANDAAATGKRIESNFSNALGGAALEIRQTEVKGTTKYRLRATGYADRNAANAACNRLKASGQQCFVAAR